MMTARNFRLTRQKSIALLQKLGTSTEKTITVFLPSGMPMSDIITILKKLSVTRSIPSDVIGLAGKSITGLGLFWGPKYKVLISPPFPMKENYITNGYDVEALISLLAEDFTIGIVLVRLGSYSIGICQGEKIIDHFTGTGLVHGRHRQGGSSSSRFQHRREDQAHHFLERVSDHIRNKFEPYSKSLDYLVYGGARATIFQLQKQCPFLRQFDNRLLPPLLEITDPRLNVLEKAVTDIRSSRITEWRESDF